MRGPVIAVILSGDAAGSGRCPARISPSSSSRSSTGSRCCRRRRAGLRPSSRAAAPIVVCNVSHRFMVAEQLRAIGVAPAAVVLEPAGHNTAPAIAAAALEARAPESSARAQSVGEPVLLVLPADHLIRDEARFAAAVREAPIEAASGRLVTFGVPPARAETGYGYIQAGRPTGLGAGVRRVDRFIEKLDARSAAAYVKDGRYWWNQRDVRLRGGPVPARARRSCERCPRGGRRSPPQGGERPRLPAPRCAGVRGIAGHIGRPCGHGAHFRGGHGAARSRLVRHRVLGDPLGARHVRRGRERRARRRSHPRVGRRPGTIARCIDRGVSTRFWMAAMASRSSASSSTPARGCRCSRTGIAWSTGSWCGGSHG